MSDNKPPSGRFPTPRSANRLGPIPGLQSTRVTPANPTLKSVLGPQIPSTDFFRRRIGRVSSDNSHGTGPSNNNLGARTSAYFNVGKGKEAEISDDFPEETTFQPRITNRTIGSSATNWRRTEPAPHLATASTSQSTAAAPTTGRDTPHDQGDIASLVAEMRLQRESDEARREDERLRRQADKVRTQARWDLDEDSKISTIISAAIKDFAADDILKPDGSNIRRWEQALSACASKRFRNAYFYTPGEHEITIPYHERIALGIIQSSVHPDLSFDILNLASSADVCAHLTSKFRIVNRARQLQAWEKLKAISLSDYTSAAEVLADFDQCARTFMEQGIDLTWDTIRSLILQGNLRDSLRSSVDRKIDLFMETHDLTAPAPIEVLRYWDAARAEANLAGPSGRAESSSMNMTLASRTMSSVSGPSPDAISGAQEHDEVTAMAINKPPRCYICQQIGHMSSECPDDRRTI
ncbi:hypothetical protein PTTG_10142, partial [Puccinia triticina 1-1 BBBD Race 1]